MPGTTKFWRVLLRLKPLFYMKLRKEKSKWSEWVARRMKAKGRVEIVNFKRGNYAGFTPAAHVLTAKETSLVSGLAIPSTFSPWRPKPEEIKPLQPERVSLSRFQFARSIIPPLAARRIFFVRNFDRAEKRSRERDSTNNRVINSTFGSFSLNHYQWWKSLMVTDDHYGSFMNNINYSIIWFPGLTSH